MDNTLALSRVDGRDSNLNDGLLVSLPLLFAQICIKLIDFFRPDPQAAQKTKDGDSTP